MCRSEHSSEPQAAGPCRCGCDQVPDPALADEFSLGRRGFLQGVGCGAVGAALGGLTAAAATAADAAAAPPAGKPLRVKAILTCEISRRQEKTSFRSYGAIDDAAKVGEELKRITDELKELAARAEFPIEVLPVAAVDNDQQAEQAAAAECDVLLVYPAGGSQIYKIAAAKTPKVIFVRHKSPTAWTAG